MLELVEGPFGGVVHFLNHHVAGPKPSSGRPAVGPKRHDVNIIMNINTATNMESLFSTLLVACCR